MEGVREVFEFLGKNRFGFLATQEPEGARVRPFMFQFEDGGCPLFCTANFREPLQNPFFEPLLRATDGVHPHVGSAGARRLLIIPYGLLPGAQETAVAS